MPAALIVVAAIVALLVVTCIGLYNGVVRKDNRCDSAWQTIDVQLQGRNDLIPNLVKTVRGYASNETKALADVTKARAAVSDATTPTAKMAASNELSSALYRLLSLAESYPELKASASFRQLQADLTDAENRIDQARMGFNDLVLEYNNAITTFPGNLVVGSRFRKREGFEVTSESVRQTPQTNL